MAGINDITIIVVGVVVGVIGLLITDSMITAGNFSGTVATLINLVPVVIASVILFVGIRGLMFWV